MFIEKPNSILHSDSDYDINSWSDDMNQLDPLIDDPLFTNTYSSDSSENSDSDE